MLTVVFHLGGKAIGLLAPASATEQDRECAELRRQKQDGPDIGDHCAAPRRHLAVDLIERCNGGGDAIPSSLKPGGGSSPRASSL